MMRKEIGDDFGALDYLKKAAYLLQSSSEKSTEIKSSQDIYTYDTESILLAVYNNMASLHNKNCEFDDAVKCCEQALEKNGSPSEMAKVRNKLGCLYFCDGKYEQARKYHAKAIELIDESHPCWVEFKRNFDSVDQRCEHVKNKKKVMMECKEQPLTD
jgi:tetratricopeptide (TPR) repeat protein